MTDNTARIFTEEMVEALMPGAKTALRDLDMRALWRWLRSVPEPVRTYYRDKHTTIRLTSREFDIVAALAKSCGLSPAAFARYVLFDFMRHWGVYLPETAGASPVPAVAGEGEQGRAIP